MTCTYGNLGIRCPAMDLLRFVVIVCSPGAKIPELHVPMRKRTAKEEKRKGVESSVFFWGGSVSLKRLTMVGWKVAKA